MAVLNKKDYEILDFICEETKSKGFPPSVREIGAQVGLTSTASVYNRMKKLEDAGLIVKGSSKNRALKVVNYGKEKEQPRSEENICVPIYGRVAAGLPIGAVQNNEDTLELPASLVRSRDLFILKVQGESMIDAAILDGDYILVNHQPTAENGDIVVALVNNNEEATVKTFYKEKGHFRLQPQNDLFEPIIVDEVSIVGKVVGVFREL